MYGNGVGIGMITVPHILLVVHQILRVHRQLKHTGWRVVVHLSTTVIMIAKWISVSTTTRTIAAEAPSSASSSVFVVSKTNVLLYYLIFNKSMKE